MRPLAVALALALTGCATENCAIIPASQGGSNFTEYYGAKPGTTYWTPSWMDVIRFEWGLAAYLRGPAHVHPIWVRSELSHYKQHFVGVVTEGRRLIWVSFTHENQWPEGIDWSYGVPLIFDGGPIQFRVWYDPATRGYWGFETNSI